MSELPQISGAELVRGLEKLGFTLRRRQGSHMVMRRALGGTRGHFPRRSR